MYVVVVHGFVQFASCHEAAASTDFNTAVVLLLVLLVLLVSLLLLPGPVRGSQASNDRYTSATQTAWWTHTHTYTQTHTYNHAK